MAIHPSVHPSIDQKVGTRKQTHGTRRPVCHYPPSLIVFAIAPLVFPSPHLDSLLPTSLEHQPQPSHQRPTLSGGPKPPPSLTSTLVHLFPLASIVPPSHPPASRRIHSFPPHRPQIVHQVLLDRFHVGSSHLSHTILTPYPLHYYTLPPPVLVPPPPPSTSTFPTSAVSG